MMRSSGANRHFILYIHIYFTKVEMHPGNLGTGKPSIQIGAAILYTHITWHR